jgi:hydroxymethylbilane synthase
VATELVVVETYGDRRTDVPLSRIGGQGVFVTEVQAAVSRGDADVAVHSAKDLPASPGIGESGLILACLPERADPRDVLVGATLATLPTGATVATGSARRRVQLADLRHDLTFADLRGNMATRLARVGSGGATAVVVARAALDRLEWEAPDGMPMETLSPSTMVPQVAQGALALECRHEDHEVLSILELLDDAGVRAQVEAERAFLAELGGGCTLPVGAHAVFADSESDDRPHLRLTGIMGCADGRVVLRHTDQGADGPALGRRVARYLLDDAGGAELGPWSPG